MLCVSWQFYYKDLQLFKHSLLLLMNVDFLPQLLHIFICLHRMEWRIFKSISKKTFLLWQITEKKILVKHCSRKKSRLFFFFTSGKAEQQSRCTGEKQICWLCTMEWKVHFVLLPFQAAYRLQCGMKKKKKRKESTKSRFFLYILQEIPLLKQSSRGFLLFPFSLLPFERTAVILKT